MLLHIEMVPFTASGTTLRTFTLAPGLTSASNCRDLGGGDKEDDGFGTIEELRQLERVKSVKRAFLTVTEQDKGTGQLSLLRKLPTLSLFQWRVRKPVFIPSPGSDIV
ncbi:hypothetical protein M378DRAFT_169059 [Amanita muscaria Koide BX008]|uniref:Uncharacterized protein n=1 Tax=Amanita muscaria (strain Koide BX008) TaxID=946122 RepID=A0A0C2WTK0_AMAMK|nr:hypothetical protein M378DRAFT_169059 [Amanita muscaria Koide BX008]